MKIEKITENKIRVIINTEELNEKKVTLNSLVKNTDSAQELFKFMLEEAQKQVGFVVDDARLLVEAYSTPDGLFIITFTKFNNIESTSKNKPPKRLSCKRKIPNNSLKNAIYEFRNFEEFCNFCNYANNSRLGDLKGFAKSILLYEYNNLYYLTLNNIHTDFEFLDFFYTAISEFAKLVSNSTLFRAKLDERGNVIFRANAIRNGIKYFAKN